MVLECGSVDGRGAGVRGTWIGAPCGAAGAGHRTGAESEKDGVLP